MNCQDPGRGTYWSLLFSGKQSYIDLFAPGTTHFGAQSKFDWVGNSGNRNPKPSYVQDNLPNGPSIDFIFKELSHGEDVEILLSNGHYVTLTGIDYNLDDLIGSLSYVDPFDGKKKKADIAQGEANDPITFVYNGQFLTIDAAVSESPIPEPSAIFLLSTGILILLAARVSGRLRNQQSRDR